MLSFKYKKKLPYPYRRPRLDLGSRYLIKTFIFKLIDSPLIKFTNKDIFYSWIPDLATLVWDDERKYTFLIEFRYL